ncbi:mannitol dehydrogenase family protein [Chryseobacterium jejuense]|uniref:Mannitol 2-dehydrogenase n=1 Tax=Chryseobacterium jejuense TaxID=445960 RepID=A0A2X2X3D5_CHRJE|nr:mannitol dehydrogenase family protein [Chryseobacterium jejuense]SDI13141.1 mannitol 2-dehydrogenase [Chryseobacterium jejuense]SQB46437.1 Polyol:NADP oxidoreductase [Chryseobacterium jejuense]
MSIIYYHYNASEIRSGILHIGVGNFHRAHQQFYTNILLNDEDQKNWGICGVCLLPSDEKIVKNLRAQNLNYSLTVYGRNGEDEVYKIGSLKELIWGVEDPEAVVRKIADSSIKIITLTITEGGYNLDKESGKFILNDEKIQHDLNKPAIPATVFGFVAEGLRQRKMQGGDGVTILSCDNLQHNGNTAKRAFMAFIEAQDKDLAEWVEVHVTFPNSMVDRITPATTAEDIERLNKQNGTNDYAPVYCEDFAQWVIEDNFISGRPAWERVGVEFTDDVTAFENMKLSLLNASHTLLSYPAFLMGYRKVDQAMEDRDLVKFIRDFMDKDITPFVPAPENTDLEKYKETLIERFANHSVSDQVSRLCFDGVSKFPVYIIPNLDKMIKTGADLTRPAFLIASYRHYLKYKTDDQGNVFEIGEPWLTENDKQFVNSEEPQEFLELSAFKGVLLKDSEQFIKLYSRFVEEIKDAGTASVLQSIIK